MGLVREMHPPPTAHVGDIARRVLVSESRSQVRARLREEAKVRASRRLTQETELFLSTHAPTSPSTPLGEPLHNRVVRVTRAGDGARAGKGRWSNVTTRDAHRPPETLRQLGTRGIAPGAHTLDTVRVTTADGRSRIAPISEFRRSRTTRRVTQVTEVPRMIMAGDLAPIGNVE